MGTGAFTGYIDVAQVALYAFWIFFAGLIWYLRQEDRREGYPLENDRTGEFNKDPWLFVPKAKTFVLPHGQGTVSAPDGARDERPINAEKTHNYDGAPLAPTGDPMLAGVGPAAWTERADHPDMTPEGEPRIVPMRVASDFSIAEGDPDPRGMAVIGADKAQAGSVTDVWVDRGEHLIRYLEVSTGAEGAGPVLLPMPFCLIRRGRGGIKEVYVHAITSAQFANVPTTASSDQVTLLEEDKISAYYGGGQLYATPRRQEAWL